MSLPIQPDVETVLQACAETLRDVLLPEIETDWGRYSAELCVASLEYALGLLAGDRNAARREELAAAIERLRPEVERLRPEVERLRPDIEQPRPAAAGSPREPGAQDAGDPWIAALAAPSPFEAASALLVAGQNDPGPLADRVRETLRPLLHQQLDAEMAAAMPLFAAFARNMAGR